MNSVTVTNISLHILTPWRQWDPRVGPIVTSNWDNGTHRWVPSFTFDFFHNFRTVSQFFVLNMYYNPQKCCKPHEQGKAVINIDLLIDTTKILHLTLFVIFLKTIETKMFVTLATLCMDLLCMTFGVSRTFWNSGVILLACCALWCHSGVFWKFWNNISWLLGLVRQVVDLD